MKALTFVFVLLTVFIFTTGYSETTAEEAVTTVSPEEKSTVVVENDSTKKSCLPHYVFMIDSKIFVDDSRLGIKTVNIEKSFYEFSKHPSFTVLVENISKRPVRTVQCVMEAIKYKTVIDRTTACFNSLQYIEPGGKAKMEAIFIKLDSHEDYDYVEYTLK